MKTIPSRLIPLLGFCLAAPLAQAAAENSPSKDAKTEMRAPAGPERPRPPFPPRGPERMEMETVAFLGVETGPVSPTLGAQLGLTRGTGLVVNHVAPKSPADGVLKEHDILLKLDEQILIETKQLAVLVRSHKEGDEVSLTYLRGGQKNTVKIKLGEHKVPKFGLEAGVGPRFFERMEGVRERVGDVRERMERARAEAERVISLMRRPPGAPGEPQGPMPPPEVRMRIERQGGPGFRAIRVTPGNSTLVFSDEEGSLELTSKEGAKTLVAKDAKGGALFSGPVTTPEERRALPANVRARLEKLEGMRDVTFRTDEDFQAGEAPPPRPQGIALPQPERAPRLPPVL